MTTVYNKRNAANALNISVETLDRYKDLGKLPYHSIGTRIVFTESDLMTFLENCAVPAVNMPTDREKKEMAKAAGGGL